MNHQDAYMILDRIKKGFRIPAQRVAEALKAIDSSHDGRRKYRLPTIPEYERSRLNGVLCENLNRARTK